MKLVYCPKCEHVSMKSRAERNTCERCGGPARIAHVRPSWRYLAGAGILLAGALFLLLPQVSPGVPWAPAVETLGLRILWLLVFVGIGYVFASSGVRAMKAKAIADARAADPEARA